MTNFEERNLDKVIDVLHEDIKSTIPWVQRKEISAWSSIIFYYAILWSSGKFFASPERASIHPLCVIFFLFCLGFIFSRFVHAQYQSIYHKKARQVVLEKLLLGIVERRVQFFDDNNIKTHNDLLDYIKQQTTKEKNSTMKGKVVFHLFRIMIYFWICEIITKIFHMKRKSHNLDNNERGAAALYSLILLGGISSIYFYVKSSPPLARQCWEVLVVISAFLSSGLFHPS